MNDFLNEGKLRYDTPRYDEMYVFLNHILTIAKSNNMDVSDRLVYGELEKFTLPRKDLDLIGRPKKVEHLFAKWINRFREKGNISVYNTENWPYWCQFVNKGYANEFIKLYVPINEEGLEECVNLIFDFMAQHDMSHQSKVGKFLRNDNVVIRLNKGDEKSLRMLLDFINNNPKIQQHLNKTNPFLPNINGIGVMNETGITYNGELCELISRYVNERRNQSKLDVQDFIKYVKENTYKQEIYSAFDHATNIEPGYFDANENIYGPVRRGLSNIQKQTLLNDTLIATYQKYGMDQVHTALMKAIRNNDYGYFTNEGYRNMLRKNVSRNEIEQMISSNVHTIFGREYTNLRDMIYAYCSYLLEDQMVFRLDEMCEVTLENRGIDFLKRAIEGYCSSGNPRNFSRFKQGDTTGRNYRENCRYIPQHSMITAVRKSLKSKGIDASYIPNDRLAQMYVQALQESRYEVALNEDNDMKFYR